MYVDLECVLKTPSAKTIGLMLLLLIGLFGYTMVTVKATAETFNIPAGESVVRTVDLNVDDEVSGSISVVGTQGSNNVDFMVSGPVGNVILPPATVGVSTFNFKATDKGTYSFVFDNSKASEDKAVSLNYEVRHYWFGMPQEFVLMLIVVFVGVLGLVIYAMVSKR